MSQARDEPKWGSLLQPIKQLELSWDIDIAAELADYLEELSTLTFEVDGQSNLNFSEAAMVVHSSSCTYSKKVDCLMKLTLAALESAKAKQQESTSAAKKRKVGTVAIILLPQVCPTVRTPATARHENKCHVSEAWSDGNLPAGTCCISAGCVRSGR